MTNLVDMVSSTTVRHSCSCGLAVREVSGVWRDGGGQSSCWSGLPHLGRIYVQPSPLLQVRRDS
jgi:hypothetical protein